MMSVQMALNLTRDNCVLVFLVNNHSELTKMAE